VADDPSEHTGPARQRISTALARSSRSARALFPMRRSRTFWYGR